MGCFWQIVVQKAKPKITSYKVLRKAFIRKVSTANYLKAAWLLRKSCCWLAHKHLEHIWIFLTWITFKNKQHYFYWSIWFSITPSNSIFLISYCFLHKVTCCATIPQVPRNSQVRKALRKLSMNLSRLHLHECMIYIARSAWMESYS